MKNFLNLREAYNNNRTGFARRPREDDEYHTPDPVTQTHRIAFNVSKDGAEKHSRTVTISNSTKSKAEATATARAHLQKQGYKIHEEVQIDELKKSTLASYASKAADKAAMHAFGAGGESTRYASEPISKRPDSYGADRKQAVKRLRGVDKALSRLTKEETDVYAKSEENKRSADAAKKQGDMFAHHMHMADHHDNLAQWHSENGRHSVADTHHEKSEAHHEKAMALKEEVDLDEAVGHTIEAHGIRGMKGTPWRKTFKSQDHLNDWAEKNDSVEVHGTRDLEGAKKKTNEDTQLDELSDTTLNNYVSAARKDRERNKVNKAAPDTAQRANANERDKKRIAGMNKAKSYLMPGTAGHAKNQARRAANEETQLDEIKMTAAMKLQTAFQREMDRAATARKAGDAVLKGHQYPAHIAVAKQNSVAAAPAKPTGAQKTFSAIRGKQ